MDGCDGLYELLFFITLETVLCITLKERNSNVKC